jgi:hypothetical protein
MGFIPSFKLSVFRPFVALIHLGMTGVAQGRNTVVVGFESHALAVALLVGMGGYHCAILRPADLAW